ncbi:MAG: YbaK/EbsC family protein [Peptococcaceae bacterium]|nr:YbaK/EbsC family protein [Peptococcaceae bacterium]
MSSIENVKRYLRKYGAAEKVREFAVSSATVELAAQALAVEPARIAKSLTFSDKDGGCIMVVAAGDAKINNGKFKRCFGCKPSMLAAGEVLEFTGHAVGGVCPFALPEKVPVYLDESMKRFITVFPAAGSASSAVELTLSQLEEYSRAKDWVDVCKGWQDEEEEKA